MTRAEWARRPGRSSNTIRRSLRMAIYARDNFDCVHCRGVFPLRLDGSNLTLDHVVPRKHGGRSTADNLVTCCKRCNFSRKHRWLAGRADARVQKALARPVDRELGRQLARLNGYKL